MWLETAFCDILVKNVAAFCLCMKSLPQAKVKRFRLISLMKKNLKRAWYKFCYCGY